MLMDKHNVLANGIDLANIPAAATTLGTAVPTTPTDSMALSSRNRRLTSTQIDAFIHGASATLGTSLRILLYVSESATAKTNAVVVGDSGVVLLANLTIGSNIPIAVNPAIKLNSSGVATDLFLILEFIQAGAAFGAGKLTFGIMPLGDMQTAQV